MIDENKRFLRIFNGEAFIDYECLSRLPTSYILLKCNGAILYEGEIKDAFSLKLPSETVNQFISLYLKMDDEEYFLDDEFNPEVLISTDLFKESLQEVITNAINR